MAIEPVDVDPITIQERLFAWYAAHHRTFPWRSSDDPWGTLVLEVMSQQTQLDRVTEAWVAFIERWPDPSALAAASAGEVIGFWSEHRLGYNRRARYLHEAACHLVETHDGEVPGDPTALERLPGVGPYTANAVASMAFDRGEPVVDTNVRRVIHRFTGGSKDVEAHLDHLAAGAPVGRWNEAIMELGGIACSKRPRCDEASCPLRSWCRAYATGDFSAPDVSSQAAYAGSRRELRGDIVRFLHERDEASVEAIVNAFDGRDETMASVEAVIDDLVAESLVEVTDEQPVRVRLPQ